MSVLLPKEALFGSSWQTWGPSSSCAHIQPWLVLGKGNSTVVFPGSLGKFGTREAGCDYSPETGDSAVAGSNLRVMEEVLAHFEPDPACALHLA